MTLAVLIPTIDERADIYIETEAAYWDEDPDWQVWNVQGCTWGGGINHLMPLLPRNVDYVLFAPDDLHPHRGWFDAGRAMLDTGVIPVATYLENGFPLNEAYDERPHGTPLDWTRLFLLTPAIYKAVGPLLDTTWYTDCDYSARLIAAGFPLQACDGFVFDHLDAPRTWRTDAVAEREQAMYARSMTP